MNRPQEVIKLLFFIVPSILDTGGVRYGYPEKISDIGPYWTNIPDTNNFKRI